MWFILRVSCEQQLKRGVWRKDSRPLFSEDIEVLKNKKKYVRLFIAEVADLSYNAETGSLVQLVAQIKKDVAQR